MRIDAIVKRALCALSAVAVLAPSPCARAGERGDPFGGKRDRIERILVLDGSMVHNVGNLQMNVTNWGFLGSLPKARYPMSDLPSAQWPAGSGVEYLYAAGIWVGAIKNGTPLVSTGYPEGEFYPTSDAGDRIYETFEGDPRGGRYPQHADDDGDGRVDEDWLNGLDDDLDGMVDEDYASYGTQMFQCSFRDDQDVSRVVWPEHTPMNLHIRQETFQWAERDYQDFVVVRYHITNTGTDFLEDVRIAIFADLDAGPREYGSYHMDDMIGSWFGGWCGPKDNWEWPVDVGVVYVYDNDGDGGRTPGYFGIIPFGLPSYFPMRQPRFEIFRGLQPFASGGEPTNDYERYEALARVSVKPDTDVPNDYKVLVQLASGISLPPFMTVVVDAAFVAGESLEDMLDNASAAVVAYEGTWYDLDGRPETGILGRQCRVIGPIPNPIDPDICDSVEEAIKVEKGETLWTNCDCFLELFRYRGSGCHVRTDALITYFQTGVDGKEYNLHWTIATSPTPPAMRLIAGDHKVTVLWDNTSEVIPDLLTGEFDFEGYRVMRADDWHRPRGTDEHSGPSLDLWDVLIQRDVANSLPPDDEFRYPFEEGGWMYEPLMSLGERDILLAMYRQHLSADPEGEIPCPPDLDRATCDTLEAVARFALGLPEGRRYYKYVDERVKNGLSYFYSVIAFDHVAEYGVPTRPGLISSPMANFDYVVPRTDAQESGSFDERMVYVVPNPATAGNMAPWRLQPNNEDPSGWKIEFRNLPRCRSVIRVYTVAGDLVQVLRHNGSGGDGTCPWNLLTRNGQDVTSGVYIYSVDPEDPRFQRVVDKFVVIR